MMNNRQGGEALLNFIASGFKKGGTVTSFQFGGSVGDAEARDAEGGPGGRVDTPDVSGMGDLAAAAKEATRGMSDSEREAAAQAAIDAMDADRGGDRDEQERAITRLFEEEILKATQDNIAAMQGDAEAQARIDAITGAPTAAEALAAARGQPDPAKEQALLAAAALDAAERAARTTAPEPQETVTGKAIEQAVSEPIDFVRPTDSPAQRGGLYSSALGTTQPTFLQDTALNNLMGGTAPSAPAAPPAPTGIETTSVTPPSPYEQGTLPAGTYTEKDLAQARSDLASAQFAAPPTFGAAAGKPRLSQAGILGGIFDAVANPEASLANAISERGIKSIDGQPTGREGGLEVVQADGRTAAYDPERNIVFDSDPFKGVNPFGDERVPEGIQALYNKKNIRDAEEREREGRGDDELILPEDVEVEEEEAPRLPPTIDIVPFRPEDFRYFTAGNFAYNRGIPSMMNMRTQ